MHTKGNTHTHTQSNQCYSLQLCISAGGSGSCSFSGLKVVIRAASPVRLVPGLSSGLRVGQTFQKRSPPRHPAAASQQQNSRIAALSLKIVMWTGEGWSAGCVEGAAGWRMNDRGVEAEQERRGRFIPFHIQSQCYHSGAEEKESCRAASLEPA